MSWLGAGDAVAKVCGEAVDGTLLHRRSDVAVDVDGRGDRGVPEAFLDDLRVLAELQQQGRVGVPQPFEGDAGQALDLGIRVEVGGVKGSGLTGAASVRWEGRYVVSGGEAKWQLQVCGRRESKWRLKFPVGSPCW